MKKVWFCFCFVGLGLFAPHMIFCQKDVKKLADVYFEAKKYCAALNHYKSYQKTEQEAQLLIKRGICYLYCNQPDGCIQDMALADKLKSINPDRFKYSALAYFAKMDYLEAAKLFKTYLNTLKVGSPAWHETVHYIKKCGFAKQNKYLPQLAFVENLGRNVNTEFDEYGPIQSPTKQGRFYFSSARSETNGGLRDQAGLEDVVRGFYSADMFQIDLINGNWSAVLPFEPLLCSPKHDILQDFSTDGSIIYYIKSHDLTSGTLYSDTFNLSEDDIKMPAPTILPFKAELGDKDLYVFSDSLIIFSGNRPEGFGGYDLYYAQKKLGQWQEAVNFGSNINTSSNELAPFLAKNGKTIFFSSDRLETYGGYDIFRSDYNKERIWSQAINLQMPINSPGDELDVELSSDGMSALFSSDRIESYGGFDLYIAYFKDQLLEQLDYVESPDFLPNVDITSALDSLKTDSVEVIEKVKDVPQESVKDFVIKPLFFRENEDVLNPGNMTMLRKLADIMVVYPDIKISLTSHYVSEGRMDFDVYFSIKRAEKVAEQLMLFGIAPERIYLIGCGANLPLAAPYVNGISSTLADKTNRRIDIDLVRDFEKYLKVIHEKPIVATQFRDVLWDTFNEKNQGITFRVRFAQVSQMLKNDLIDFDSSVVIEKNGTEQKYTYTMGNFTKFSEAQNLKSILAQKFIQDLEIIPYKKGVAMLEDEIELNKDQYAELQFFLQNKK